jgi:hypothetical protein
MCAVVTNTHCDERYVCCSECIYGGCASFEIGVKYQNNDLLAPFKVQTRGDCCGLCRINQNCSAWTTVQPLSGPPALCWLQSRAERVSATPDTASGTVTRYVATPDTVSGTITRYVA